MGFCTSNDTNSKKHIASWNGIPPHATNTMIIDLTVVKNSTSKAGVNPGSVPNSDSSMRSRSSWSPVLKNVKCNRVLNSGILVIANQNCKSILSLLLSGLVCSFLRTCGIDGMALWRSSISALAREPAQSSWTLESHSTSYTSSTKWVVLHTFVNNNFKRSSYHWLPGTSSAPFSIWWYSVAAQQVKYIWAIGRK